MKDIFFGKFKVNISSSLISSIFFLSLQLLSNISLAIFSSNKLSNFSFCFCIKALYMILYDFPYSLVSSMFAL